MASAPFGNALRHLLKRLGPPSSDDSTDGTLLAQFVINRDEAAFATVVARHGAMVLGVCRRLLRNAQDAEDAFQATFLVLARKAAALDGQRSLAPWLYTVARNLSLKLRDRAARRHTFEKEAGTMSAMEPRDETAWREVREVLDDELGRLPEKYRAPLVLCHLEGKSHEAAAQELGWPTGSMAKRLARGQALLRERLAGRGITLSVAGLAALENGSNAVSAAVAQKMSTAAALYYVGGELTAASASAEAVALAGGALQAMSMTKLKITALAVLLVVCSVGAGAGVLALWTEPRQPAAIAATEPAVAADPENELRENLEVGVVLEKGIGPGATLADALEYLGDRFDLPLFVDEAAFAGLEPHNRRFGGNGERAQDASVSLPKMTSVPMREVLCLLLNQVELNNGMVAGFRMQFRPERNALCLVIAPREIDESDMTAFGKVVLMLVALPALAEDAETRAVESVTSFGGKIVRDGRDGAGPVVAVDLSFTRVTDAELKHLAAFKDLRSVAVRQTTVA